LGEDTKLVSFLVGFVQIIERLFNQEKKFIHFLKSLLSQALWVAAK
tara:strand:+ start:357 stop:494 length:138 start_codon:yes stop_codon:yes gene_type:complete